MVKVVRAGIEEKEISQRSQCSHLLYYFVTSTLNPLDYNSPAERNKWGLIRDLNLLI